MTLSTQDISSYADDLIKLSMQSKKIIVDEIISIIKPYEKESGYIDYSNYVNGFLPKNEIKKYFKITKLPNPIYIPESLTITDKTLYHFCSDDDYSITTEFICSQGLYLDFGSFSDFYEHSEDILKVILVQLRNMKF